MSDQRAALTYSSYLALDEVLAERPRTDEHDELLFIVISTRSTSCGSTSSSTLCCPVERPEDEPEWLASLQLGDAPLVGPMRDAPFASTWHACWTLRAEAAPANAPVGGSSIAARKALNGGERHHDSQAEPSPSRSSPKWSSPATVTGPV
jgi:hypothetical protein